jgi:dihydroorotate dehydrogenase electron transfer subunit
LGSYLKATLGLDILFRMAAPPTDAKSCLAELISVEPCGDDGILIRLRPAEPLTEGGAPLAPNRFFMLRREDGLSPAIPRPFSIYREEDGDVLFMVKVIGDGTRALAASRPGEKLRLIGPLGLGWPDFSLPDGEGLPWVFLAGGIGSAPFYMAVQAMTRAADAAEARGEEPCEPPYLLYGAATRGLLFDLDAFAELDCSLHIATDDGSFGFHGHTLALLDHLIEAGLIPARVRLAACGPLPMLRAAAAWAEARELTCWVSLEELMGCGVGICNGCVVETKPEGPLGSWPNAKACVEGPAFPTSAVVL